MAVNPSTFGPCPQFINSSGQPAVGDKLFFYAAGTTTKLNTYTDSTGSVANANPIVLNSLGEPSTQIWFTNGSTYKMVWAPSTDTDPPTSPIRTFDNLPGMNDTSAYPSSSEWVLSPSTPTYVNGTSFTVPGNQTATLMIGRRVKTTNTAGTVYSTITNSVYTTLTTITVSNDSGAIDSGLSVLNYGLLSATNQSIPAVPNIAGGVAGAILYQTGVGTTGFSAAGVSGQTLTSGGTGAPTFQYKSERIQPVDYSLAGNALTLKLNPTTLDFRSTTLTDGSPTTVSNASQITLTISSGSTLGTTSAVQSDIAIIAINNAGTMELAAVNISGGTDLSETGLISTTAEGGAGAADSATTIYSTTARSNVAYKVVGIFRSTQTTAGTWAQTPSLVQGAGGQAITAMSSIGYGQTLLDVTVSRAGATTYYNTTGKPIKVYIQANAGGSSGEFSFSINGGGAVPFARCDVPSGTANLCGTFDVPIAASYRVTASVGSFNLIKWWEQR